MKKVLAALVVIVATYLLVMLPSCNNGCIDEIFLETLKVDLQVNAENLGIFPNDPKNSTDTIRSKVRQFYNYPTFRRFSHVIKSSPSYFIPSVYAAGDCPEKIEYISRFDTTITRFSLDVSYDASIHGLGIIPADSNLLAYPELRTAYFRDFYDNGFLNGGAPTSLTIIREFFIPINDQWIEFTFSFEEFDGTVFSDECRSFVDMVF